MPRLATVIHLCACFVCGLLPPSPLMAATGGNLTVVTFQPQGQVESLSQIVVRFSEAMRPLGVMEQDPATSPLQLTVAGGNLPAGQYRWLDPETLAYLFDRPVMAPLTVEARVAAGLKALSGARLVREVRWSVRTPPLKLDVDEKISLPPDGAGIRISSNYPLDPETLRHRLSVRLGRQSLAFEVRDANPIRVRGPQQQSRWTYLVSIKDTLPPNKTVQLVLASGLAARGGYEPLTARTWSFNTYQDLKLERWTAGYGGSAKRMQPEEDVLLHFNNPVSPARLLEHLDMQPKPLPLAEDDTPDRASPGHALSYRWEPRTTYQVTVRAGLRDEYGTVLKTPLSLTFETGDYEPFFSMQTGVRFLERDRKGLFPLFVRNIPAVTVRLRYAPWSDSTLRWFDRSDNDDADAVFPEVAGRMEKTLTLDFSGQPNENIWHELDLPHLFRLPGVEGIRGPVEVTVRVPNAREANRTDEHRALVQVTNLGVTYKGGRDDGLVWVTSLDKAEPLRDVQVTLHGASRQPLWRGATGADGVAEIPGSGTLDSPIRLLMARRGTDVSVLSPTSEALPASSRHYGGQWNVHLVSQLPLYQPGQTVRFTLFARTYSDETPSGRLPALRWQPLAGQPLTVNIRDQRAKIVHTEEAVTNAYGSVSGEFTLSEEASLGSYSVQVQRRDESSVSSAHAFQVAAFRPPEFRVDLEAPASRPALLPDEPFLQASVCAGYFSGAPLAEAPVRVDVVQADSWYRPDLLAGYRVGPDSDSWIRPLRFPPGMGTARSDMTTQLETVLDNEGRAAFTVPVFASEESRPQRISLEATVTDASGLTSQGAASFLIHPAAVYVGLRVPYFLPLGRDVTVDLKAASWDNQPVPQARVVLRAEKIRADAHENPAYDPVWEKTVHLTNVNGQAVDVRLDQSGNFRLTAMIEDAQGRKNVAAVMVYVPGPDSEWISNRPSGSMALMADQDSYKPGETASIVLKNPYAEALALITTERGGIRTYTVREVSGPAPTVTVPLTADDAPYVHVSVTLVRGRILAPFDIPGDSSHDLGSPQVAQGTQVLKVEADDKPDLAVSVQSDKSEYRPGESVSVDVAVTDRRGAGKKAQVTLLAVDERILRAAGERLFYDPAETFSLLYLNGVVNADTRTSLINLSPPLMRRSLAVPSQARMAEPASPAPELSQSADLASAAGPGGEDDAIRSNFSPMAFWLAEGETDARGRLNLSFTLPDSLTAYRIVAIVADGAGFAVSQTAITATKPLQLVSALPRFAVAGDSLEARILVQNLGTEDGPVDLQATGEGLSLEKTRASLTVRAGQSGMVSFPLRATSLGQASLTVRATMGREQDSLRVTLPVLPPSPVTTVAAAGLLREGESAALPVEVPNGLDSRGSLEVIFAPSPAAGLPLAGQELLDYPWDCLEQRLSRAWLRGLRLRHGELLGLPPDDTDRDVIRKTFESVTRFQNHDGGFSLWPGLSESSLYLTAYVLLVNQQLAEVGSGLPAMSRGLAVHYLREQLRVAPDKPETGQRSPESEALALWMIAATDPFSAIPLPLRPVIERTAGAGESPFAWAALLQLAQRSELSGEPEHARFMKQVLDGLGQSAVVTPTQLHFASNVPRSRVSMGSTLRDNAMVLASLTAMKPDYPGLEGLANWVGRELGERRVLSTQEAIFGIWGLSEYLLHLGGDGTVSLAASWDGETVRRTFQKLIEPPQTWTLPADRLKGTAKPELLLSAEAGHPYWTARLRYPSEARTPENAGFSVSRSWIGPDAASQALKVGDLVEVLVTVSIPATRQHVLLFDPFPAGLEPLYATRVDLADSARRHQPPWLFQESRTDGLLLYAPKVQPGLYTYTYTLRAATPGTFIQRPTTVEEMYTPEAFGRTTGGTLTIQP